VYFYGLVGKKRELLHRYLWRKHNGEIPAGYDIHHADDNPLNNHIGNLECRTKKEHFRHHAEQGVWNTPRQLAHLAEIRQKTKEWHRSPDGLEWHRQHGLETAKSRKPVELVCSRCGKAFWRVKNAKRVFCSRACQEAARGPRKPIHRKVCDQCGKDFMAHRAKIRFCSKSCAHTAYWAKRKAASLESHGSRPA
jgi:endogenous inhibitor of DNA gyrase (YacG/DUF329 family)